MNTQEQHNESFEKNETAKLEESYCRIGKLIVALKGAEETLGVLEGRRAELDRQIEQMTELERRADRERLRRDDIEAEIEAVERSTRDLEIRLQETRQHHAEVNSELEQQRGSLHAAEQKLQDTRARCAALVEQNVTELNKCEDARAQIGKLRESYDELVQKGKDELAQCNAAAKTNSELLEKYTAILSQQKQLKQDLITAGPQCQIYGHVTLREGSPEEPYAVFAPDGTLLGTGLTHSHGWISYGPIAGSVPEVTVRVGATSHRVNTIPWTPSSAEPLSKPATQQSAPPSAAVASDLAPDGQAGAMPAYIPDAAYPVLTGAARAS